MADEFLLGPGGEAVRPPGDYMPDPGTGLAGQVPPDDAAETADPLAKRKTGWLLEEPDTKKVAQRLIQERRDQAPMMQDRKTKWRAYRWWRQGLRHVRLVRDTDRAQVRVYAPPQSASLPPSPNLCNSLIRKTVSIIMVDPMAPECEPPGASDEARGAAELSEKLLESFGSDRQLTIPQAVEDALDKAATYCSAFIYAELTPNGRMEPVQVLAHPAATDPAAPLVNPMTGTEDQAPVLKYETLDGTLADDAANARREWVPDIDLCVLTGHHLHFLPATAKGITDAHGIILCTPVTLATLMAMAPEVEWTEEKKRQVASWRPDGWEDTLPIGLKTDVAKTKSDKDGKVSDDTLCFPLKAYIRETADYEHGAYLLIAGDDVLYRGPWGGIASGPDGDQWQTFPLPVAQVRFLDDHQGDDPYGESLVGMLGPMDDILAAQLASIIQFADRVNKPREYIPDGSIIQPDQFRRRDGRPILYNADAGLPIIEQIPTFPPAVQWVIEYMTQQMQQESLTPAAQGMSTPSVRSAKQDFALAERSLANISHIKRNVEGAYIALCRLILQYYSVYFTREQRIRYVGADGQYKERAWSRTDLRGTTGVRIRRGSSTGMPLSAKMQLAREELDLGLKVQDPMAYVRYQQTLTGRLDPILGLQQDPTLQRVRGQIAAWGEGPSEDVVASGDENMMMQAAVAIFTPLPVDDDPMRARTRYMELSGAMESETFRKHAGHPAWQQGFAQAWLLAKQAAGIMTIQEQQMAQQQAMQQQAAQQAPPGEESSDSPNPAGPDE